MAIIYLLIIVIFLPKNLSAQVNTDSLLIHSIIDSVSISRIYNTIGDLSGENPCLIHGNWDTIMTRYSNSPQIYKAQDYIQSRFEQMGYSVNLFPFNGKNIFKGIEFAPKQNMIGWLISENKIFKTTDGGQSWGIQYTSTNSILQSMFSLDKLISCVVGENGIILKTSNGVNWQYQNSPIKENFFSVFLLNNNTGWICGEKGITLKTTDGGNNWQIKDTHIQETLLDIFFASDQDGWAVGTHNTILYTVDGGETWHPQLSGIANANSFLSDVYFLTSTKGFAVGSGVVLATNDGGNNWIKLNSPSFNQNDIYQKIDFIDQKVGIISDVGGTCFKTKDGGVTWNNIGSAEQSHLSGMDMLDNNTIWECGDDVLNFTINSGSTWINAPGIPKTILNNVIASKIGKQYPDDYYIICAHYDDISDAPLMRAPGADDNATGTATVIESANILSNYSFPYSILFVLFAGEEEDKLGSRFYAAYAAFHKIKIHGVINLDMVGYDKNNSGTMGILDQGNTSSLNLGEMFKSNISDWELQLNPQYSGSGGSDHESFWEHGYPAIMLIEDLPYNNPYVHTTSDRLINLGKSFLLDNARLAIGSLALLANNDSYIPINMDSIITELNNNQNLNSDQFRLYPSYPNPFNRTIKIHYYLPISTYVSAEIYNTNGHLIKQIINENQNVGDHTICWQDLTIPSGIYILFVRTPFVTETQKLILYR